MSKNKERKIDFINLITLYSLFFIMYLIITRFSFIYGSIKDWNCQHWVFPEYFRNLFYENHNLFPDYAFNIGSGQNIYNFAYFGLLNPIVLISYLLPFVGMRTYIIMSSIFMLLFGTTLMYFFIKNKYNSRIAFIGAFFYLMATPLTFHSHRHIMFVNYMPFLIMAYMGVDKYFCENKHVLLLISTALIIFTSFYFSVTGIISIIIYGIYIYLSKNKKISFRGFIYDGLKFIAPILSAVLLSGVLILPTFFSLLNGRSGESTLNIIDLIIPNFRLDNIIYSSYSMGLSLFSLYCLIENLFSKKINNRFLSIIIFLFITFPILLFLLNGGLYAESKILITFIPLVIILMCETISRFGKKFEYNKYYKYLLVLYIFSLIFSNKYVLLVLLEMFILYLIFKFMKKKNNVNYFLFITIFIFIYNIIFNCGDFLVKNNYIDNNKQYVDEILSKDKGTYRINIFDMSLNSVNRVYNNDYLSPFVYSSASNFNYKDYYYSSGSEVVHRSYGMLNSNNNILFNIYMGNKYLVGKNKNNNNSMFYEKVKDNVYVYNGVLPVGYSSNNLMSKKYFDSLSEFDRDYALLKYIIVDKDDIITNYESPFKEIKLNYEVIMNNINYTTTSNGYKFISNMGGRSKIKINDDLTDKVLLIEFDMKEQTDCKIGDSSITINGITNKLTCDKWKYQNKNNRFSYVLSNKIIKNLNISISKGNYNINNLKTYVIDKTYLSNVRDSISELVIDREKTKDNIIYGTIDSKNDGYINLSIAYDKGYKVFVDDKEVDYIRTNINFIGFKIDKGVHSIKIVYNSPLKREGMILSILGLLLLGGFYVIDFRFSRRTIKKNGLCR